ncbi:MAG: L,D-transpeptidase family protein [Desulfomonile tiedjei]|uniref:L,D-transpeptidase family protein n=1 Tax=Desulfomonile tiedjei TaxID=2358 RepID=A0A9D6V8R7_9BACT|nr:L,D-transpeptidase family protein [Desulfomonile tiedjei]
MLAIKPKKLGVPGSDMRAKKLLTLMVLVITLWSAGTCFGDPLYPVALMNWMVEGTFHALIVDKSQQRLTVWRIKDGEPSMVESYRCSTGESDGDKWVRGDMRTPEGVYFFCSMIDGRSLPTKYGFWAFTTDYPNFVDRRRGKNGDGIWLHGRDKPLAEKPDSNGCIALENQDLVKVSRFIRLQSTPMIVVEKMIMAPRSTIIERERHLREFIDTWRKAWESRDLDAYMSHYSPNFQSAWLDYRGWKEKKRKLTGRYSRIKVKLGNVYLYRQDGIVTSIFSQSYSSDGFHSTGIKVLYLVPNGQKYSIYAEDYHQAVDDPFPVAPLLVKAGVDPGAVASDKSDFRIRLVSTDEPEQTQQGETENPKPSAPSRGVMLDRIAQGSAKEPVTPAIQSNEKVSEECRADRLLVARLEPTETSTSTDFPKHISERQPFVHAGRREAFVQLQKDGNIGNGLTAAVKGPSSNPVAETREENWPEMQASADSAARNHTEIDKKRVNEFLAKWKSAWEQKKLDSFMKMYHPDFEQGAMKYSALLKSKKSFFRKYTAIRVELDRVEIRKEKGRQIVRFVQSFQGDNYRDKGWKSMVLDDDKDKGLRIVSEGWTSISGPSSDTGSKSPQ